MATYELTDQERVHGRHMRRTPNKRIECHRTRHPAYGDSMPGKNVGYFEVPTPNGLLRILVSDGEFPEEENWEHVSVSLDARCPTWDEMQRVKDMFWREDETVVQFHPCRQHYVNQHLYCLHLWRQRGKDHMLPPRSLIG